MKRGALLCAGALVLVAGRVSALEPTADDKRATQLFDGGTALYEQSKWAEAEAAFQASWDLRRAFDTAANLGDCELHVGQQREAAEHLAYALKNMPMTIPPKAEARLRERFEDARRQVGEVIVSVNQPGAALAVDGRPVGTSPLAASLFVDPGAHGLSATLAGYRQADARVELTPGQKTEVALTLVPVAGGAGGTEVTTSRRPLWPVAVGGAAGAVFMGAGITFFLLASNKATDADTIAKGIRGVCSPTPTDSACAANASARSDHDTYQSIGAAGLIVGGAAIAGTLTYLLWPSSKPSAPAAFQIAPMVGGETHGVVLGAHF